MTADLQKKVDRAVRLIQSSATDDSPIEVAYSGGKDSDVILRLAQMSGVNIRPIYRNTTIDPPGTIKHALDNGVEIARPKKTFRQLLETRGYPSRRARFCCEVLKEYPILDRVIIGVRREESARRAARYHEPEVCRVYKNGKQARQYLPILDWTKQDIAEFIADQGIRCHPLYYDEQGRFHPERRLGCMCCPLASKKHRLVEFHKF